MYSSQKQIIVIPLNKIPRIGKFIKIENRGNHDCSRISLSVVVKQFWKHTGDGYSDATELYTYKQLKWHILFTCIKKIKIPKPMNFHFKWMTYVVA